MTTETCKVYFNDGTTMRFEFNANTEDTISVANDIHKIGDTNTLCFELDGRLIFLHTQNIKMIEVTPSPKNLPSNVFRGASHIT